MTMESKNLSEASNSFQTNSFAVSETGHSAQGWFDVPLIDGLYCRHDVCLPDGDTIVSLEISGWGLLIVSASIDGVAFRWWRFAKNPKGRIIDFLVPVGCELVVQFMNPLGLRNQMLAVNATSSNALPLPRFSGVRGTHMPPLDLQRIDTLQAHRLMMQRMGVRSELLNPNLTSIESLSERLDFFQRNVANQKHYVREYFRPSYTNLNCPGVDMTPVQQRLREWMAEIQAGVDESELERARVKDSK
jgi:hypothetical protein